MLHPSKQLKLVSLAFFLLFFPIQAFADASVEENTKILSIFLAVPQSLFFILWLFKKSGKVNIHYAFTYLPLIGFLCLFLLVSIFMCVEEESVKPFFSFETFIIIRIPLSMLLIMLYFDGHFDRHFSIFFERLRSIKNRILFGKE